MSLSQGSGGTFDKFAILTGSATGYPGFLQTVTGLTQGSTYRFRFKHLQRASWVEENTTFVATSDSVKAAIQIESGSPSGMSFAIDEVYLYGEEGNNSEDFIRTADRDQVTFVLNRRRIVKREFWSGGSASILGTVTKFTDLPLSPSVGDVYKIGGNPERNTPSYYVKWTSGSVWSETVNPEEDPDEPSRYTMPHVVQIKPEWDTFYFSPRTWSARQVGDRQTNPAPPFFGNAIAEVFMRSGRLGLLAGSSIVLSRLNGTRNFFASTALEVRDTDAIIAGVARERFLSAAAFDRNLVLLSGVTPSTVAVTQMNAPRPADRETISIGADLYYPTKSGASTLYRDRPKRTRTRPTFSARPRFFPMHQT